MNTPPDIQHEPARKRFVTTVEGTEAVLDYRLEGGVMEVTHTGVPDAIGGRGVASALTQAAFEHARAEGLKVRPSCPYAAAWAKRHPDYGPLLE